jgi:nitrite reductase/ring-hydroxylating ferredoxin subunit
MPLTSETTIQPAAGNQWVRVATLAELQAKGRLTVLARQHVVALFGYNDQVYAVDNRCPHMGFPLDQGTVNDCILTCHWHHARFDLASGGTFDLWADDVRSFPVRIEHGDIWVDVTAPGTARERQHKRLKDGLERNIRLVIAKSVLGLMHNGDQEAARTPFALGLDYGARNRQNGWSTGQTIGTVMMNLVPYLDADDRPRALYTGLTAIARDCAGQPARFAIDPLPHVATDLPTLKRWFRQFIEVRDTEGAERCLASVIRAGYPPVAVADLLFAAATDHRYLDVGHVLDFTNKAFEALDWAGWEAAEVTLASLLPTFTGGQRMEETNEWRHPVNLVAILDDAFDKIPLPLEQGRAREWHIPTAWPELLPMLLGDDPQAISDGLLHALAHGATCEELAQVVVYTAIRRVVQFHISNEFGDWNTVHHTFTFANAVHQAMRRSPSPELLRGVWDAAMSVYLERFLNIPATKVPEPTAADVTGAQPDAMLEELLDLFNHQQQVNQAGVLVARYLASGAAPARLIAMLGQELLREDAGFHPIQSLEAAVRQYQMLTARHDLAPYAPHALVAAARYLAAHAPTPRAANQTYRIAVRLNRGENVFAE